MGVPKITLFEGEENELILPARFAVCPRCDGRGTHDHPAFSNGITGDDWNGPDWDDESRENYLSGVYNVQCETCDGQRVVPVLDEERCTPAQIAAYQEFLREEAEYQSICRAERSMGA